MRSSSPANTPVTSTGMSGGGLNGNGPLREAVLGVRKQRRPSLGLDSEDAVGRPVDRVEAGDDGGGEPGGRPDRAGDADQHPVSAPVSPGPGRASPGSFPAGARRGDPYTEK